MARKFFHAINFQVRIFLFQLLKTFNTYLICVMLLVLKVLILFHLKVGRTRQEKGLICTAQFCKRLPSTIIEYKHIIIKSKTKCNTFITLYTSNICPWFLRKRCKREENHTEQKISNNTAKLNIQSYVHAWKIEPY